MPLSCSSYTSAMRQLRLSHATAMPLQYGCIPQLTSKTQRSNSPLTGELLLCCPLTNVYSLTNSLLKTALTNPDQFASAFVHTSFGDLHLTKFSLK